YPANITIERWYTLTLYLHLAGLQKEVEAAARDAAGLDGSVSALSISRSKRSVVRGTTLTLTPRVQGLRFNPPSQTIAGCEDIQHVWFRFSALPETSGQSAFGVLEVTYGSLPIAHLGISINVRDEAAAAAGQPPSAQSASVYQDVFASYSSADADIVKAC